MTVWDIAVLELDGGEVKHLVAGGGVDVQPAWGPEGRFVYFATAGQGMDIHRIEVGTGRREAVAEGPGSRYQPRVLSAWRAGLHGACAGGDGEAGGSGRGRCRSRGTALGQ